MKKYSKLTALAFLLAALALLAGCSGGSHDDNSGSTDATTSATEQLLPLAENVCVRAGTDPDGEVLLDSSTMEGFMAAKDYSDSMPYGFALVLNSEGKKSFRNATRELAKQQTPITLWVGDEAVCSPTITTMINTNYVILTIASVTDDESYDATVALLSGN